MVVGTPTNPEITIINRNEEKQSYTIQIQSSVLHEPTTRIEKVTVETLGEGNPFLVDLTSLKVERLATTVEIDGIKVASAMMTSAVGRAEVPRLPTKLFVKATYRKMEVVAKRIPKVNEENERKPFFWMTAASYEVPMDSKTQSMPAFSANDTIISHILNAS